MASQNIPASQGPLQRLPAELKRYVMMNLDITSLYKLITTCKVFYEIHKSDKGLILQAVTSNALGDALPLAIALHAARRVTWGTKSPAHSHDELVDRVHKFGRKYLNRNNTPIFPEGFSPTMAWEFLSFHSVVEKFSLEFMDETMADMYFRNFRGHRIPKPTNTEIARVQATFYCMEIARELFPFHVDRPSDHSEGERAWGMLWHYFAPWENRIAESITVFLEEVLADAIDQASIDTEAVDSYYWSNYWYSLFGLRGFDKLADEELISRNTTSIDTQERHLRCDGYFVLAESGFTWLKPVGGNVMVRSFSMEHLLARFPQEEYGACDNWYFTTISKYRNPHHAGLRPLPLETVWWDRARINTVFPGILPSIAEIQGMVEGKQYIWDLSQPELDYCEEIGY
ncbi:hypothetical protein F4814DRAFT_413483 [Daldinia grandis]|nr:hypothetical protein F4814DRAFT_413483 [Daldinia grandis]